MTSGDDDEMARRKGLAGSATLGEALQAELARQGVSQRYAAEKLGVSQPTFSEWLNDKTAPSGRYLLAVGRWLGADPSELSNLLLWSNVARTEAELTTYERRQLKEWRQSRHKNR